MVRTFIPLALAGVASADVQNDAKPLGLVFSGNGMRAQAGAIGTLKALHEINILQEVSTISSVSGGSWGSTQFLFSDLFNDGVLDSSQNISSWYTNYQAVSSAGMGKAMAACGGAMNCWTGLISGMYEGFNPKFDATKAATPENRLAGASDADYLICTSLVVQGLMSDNTTTSLYKKRMWPLSPTPVKALDFPAYWAIPKAGKPTWNVPEVSVADLLVKSDATGKTAPLVLPPPSVGTVGAMSSAASGGSGAPALKAATLAKNQKSLDMWCKQFPCSGPHEAETAVCSNAAPDDINKCTFPSARFIDGAFTENQALALAIAHMQKKHPGKKLSIIGTNADACDGGADPVQCVKVSSMRSLFANGPYPTDTGEWRPYVIPSPNRTIFAESITDKQALGNPVGPATVVQQTLFKGTFTTIDNVHFGVSAGTQVNLTLINMNGGPLQAMTPKEMADLGSIAEDIRQIVLSLGEQGKPDEIVV